MTSFSAAFTIVIPVVSVDAIEYEELEVRCILLRVRMVGV